MLELEVVDSSRLLVEILQNQCEFAGPLHEEVRISEFWGQQITGADLVRSELEQGDSNYQLRHDDMMILDLVGHGELVSNLIAGPNQSALIPSDFSFPLIDARTLVGFQNATSGCLQQDNFSCPKFLNNSDSWEGSLDESEGVEKAKVITSLAQRGTVPVVSSGNGAMLVEPLKASAASNIILVAAATSSGEPTWWSSYSPEVIISAPSDEILRSYYYSGDKDDFGGTSGAAPQVAATLLNFYKVSGFHPTVDLSKRLLRKTALPYMGNPASDRYGAGMLNSYKIFKLAEKLKELCGASKSPTCFEDKLLSDSFYDLGVAENELQLTIQNAHAAFPGCNGGVGNIHASCVDQREIFDNLRRLSLLKPNHTESWKLLDCITSSSKYVRNNVYYSRMAGRHSSLTTLQEPYEEYSDERFTTEQYSLAITEHLASEQVNASSIIELLSRSSIPLPPEHKELVRKILNENLDNQSQNNFSYSNLKLGDELFADSPELIDLLLDRNSEDTDEIVLELFIWQDHWPPKMQIQWRDTIFNRRSDYDFLFILYTQFSTRDNEDFLKRVVQRGNADSSAVRYLPLAFWIENPDILSSIIDRGEAVDLVVRQIIPYLPQEQQQTIKNKVSVSEDPSVQLEIERMAFFN